MGIGPSQVLQHVWNLTVERNELKTTSNLRESGEAQHEPDWEYALIGGRVPGGILQGIPDYQWRRTAGCEEIQEHVEGHDEGKE